MEQANTYKGRSGQAGRHGQGPLSVSKSLPRSSHGPPRTLPSSHLTDPTCILNPGPQLTWALLERFLPHPLSTHYTPGTVISASHLLSHFVLMLSSDGFPYFISQERKPELTGSKQQSPALQHYAISLPEGPLSGGSEISPKCSFVE